MLPDNESHQVLLELIYINVEIHEDLRGPYAFFVFKHMYHHVE